MRRSNRVRREQSRPQAADYNLVRWRSGDCQIWNNDTNRMPWGDGWILLAWNMPNYDTAWTRLKFEVAKGNCRW